MTTNPPRLHPETADAIKAAVRLGLDSLRAEPPQRLGDWARDHFKLAGESSHKKGDWVAWPFQVGILDFMGDDRIKELDVMKAKRVGYTKMLTANIAYNIAHKRRKQALWQPTDDDRDSFVKSEIDPILDPVNGVRAINKARRKGNTAAETIKYKPFRDSVLHLLGGKAARAYRRITVAWAGLDELSKFDSSIEKSGPPRGLARGRLEGAPYPKLVCGSTPLLKGLCHIEAALDEAEGLVRFHIDCPRCGADHPLLWGGPDKPFGFKWERGKPETVRHVCPHCRESITQADYLPAGTPLPGTWVCERTGKRYGPDRTWRTRLGVPCNPPSPLGVHVWTAYSPQRPWPDIVKEFEYALVALERGDAGPRQLFANETLGETWELIGDRTDEHALQARAEDYLLCTVPKGCLMLTAGVDVQRNRWEITVYGWGRGLESWVIDVTVIEGNPAVDEEWNAVTEHLQRRYVQDWHGGTLGVSATSIDSSDQTQAVYNWVTKAQHILPRLRAIKGDGDETAHILGPSRLKEVNWRGKRVPNGIKLWHVGVDAAKDLLLGQLAIEAAGPGFVHFSKELRREFYEQLTAEQRVPAKVNGRDTFKWIKRRARNEQLDNRNYAMHAAMGLGLHKYTDAQWSRLEAAVQPERGLFAPPTAPDPRETPTGPRHEQSPTEAALASRKDSRGTSGRRGRGFVGNY